MGRCAGYVVSPGRGIAVLGMIATWTLVAQTHRRPAGDEIALAA
jgi:hypothetical protein